MGDRDLVVPQPGLARCLLHNKALMVCFIVVLAVCFQGEWGTRVARPRTVFGFVSTARLETCENIVRVGLAFLGPRWPAGPGLGCGVWPRLGKNRSTLFLGQRRLRSTFGRLRTQAAPQLPLPPARSYKTVGSWLAQACASLCASACLQRAGGGAAPTARWQIQRYFGRYARLACLICRVRCTSMSRVLYKYVACVV